MHSGGWCWLDAGRAAQINPSTGADKAHIPPAASSSYRPVQSALQRFHSHHLIFIYFSPFLGCVLLPSPSILFFSHLKRKKGGGKELFELMKWRRPHFDMEESTFVDANYERLSDYYAVASNPWFSIHLDEGDEYSYKCFLALDPCRPKNWKIKAKKNKKELPSCDNTLSCTKWTDEGFFLVWGWIWKRVKGRWKDWPARDLRSAVILSMRL